MTTTASIANRSQTTVAPPRVLVALHGYEPLDWVPETCRVLSTWAASPIQVLAVLDVPCPPLTSLTPFARRAYAAARAEWTAIERRRLEPRVEALLGGLRRAVDVAWAPAARGDLARTIADRALAWPADVVVVGAPAPGPRSWLTPGPVHHRVVRLARCTVLVVTAPGDVTAGRRRPVAVPHAATVGGQA